MDVRQLQLFIAVAEERSIHGGARRMRLAQPAVSKSLRALERQLQTQLLDRSPRGVELTPAGKALLGEAYEIVRSLDRAVDIVQHAGRFQKSLTIGLLAGAVSAAELTSDIVHSYQQLYPQVTVCVRELNFVDQFDAVADGRVDVAITRAPYTQEGVRTIPLFTEPVVLACRSDHRLAVTSRITVDQILDETMLDMPDVSKEWAGFWHLNDLRADVARTAHSVRSLTELQYALMSSNEVVMPMSFYAWRTSTHHAYLHALRFDDAPTSTSIVVVRQGEDRDHIMAFTEHSRRFARQSFGKVPGADIPE
jgi:DNA-binding transcriptional LysR family regulator